jgi:hypothetical protein
MIPFRQATPLATFGVHPVDVNESDRVDFVKPCGSAKTSIGANDLSGFDSQPRGVSGSEQPVIRPKSRCQSPF